MNQWVKIKLQLYLTTFELHEEFIILQQAPSNFIVQGFSLEVDNFLTGQNRYLHLW
jgi:hypothetical protein